MRETNIEDYLVRRVKELGGLCVKHVSPGRAGDPDRLVKLPGVPAFFVELKRPRKGLEELQAERAIEWDAVGMVCTWTDTRAGVDRILRGWQ